MKTTYKIIVALFFGMLAQDSSAQNYFSPSRSLRDRQIQNNTADYIFYPGDGANVLTFSQITRSRQPPSCSGRQPVVSTRCADGYQVVMLHGPDGTLRPVVILNQLAATQEGAWPSDSGHGVNYSGRREHNNRYYNRYPTATPPSSTLPPPYLRIPYPYVQRHSNATPVYQDRNRMKNK